MPAPPGHVLLAQQVARRVLSEPGLVFFDVVGDGAKVQVFASADKRLVLKLDRGGT